MLGIAPLRWIGLVSYSFYLWHWPVIALYNAHHEAMTLPVRVAFLLGTPVASVLSYRYVERPFRERPYRRDARRTLFIAASGMATIAILAFAIPSAAMHLKPRSLLLDSALAYLKYENDDEVRVGACFLTGGFNDAGLSGKTGRWLRGTLAGLKKTITYLEPMVGRVVVLGPIVECDQPFPRLLAQSIANGDPTIFAAHLVPAQRSTDRLFEREFGALGANYFSTYQATCPGDESSRAVSRAVSVCSQSLPARRSSSALTPPRVIRLSKSASVTRRATSARSASERTFRSRSGT